MRGLSLLLAAALVAGVASRARASGVSPSVTGGGEGGGAGVNASTFFTNATAPTFTTISGSPTITQPAGNATTFNGPNGIQIAPFNYTVSGSGSFEITWTSNRHFGVNALSNLLDTIQGDVSDINPSGTLSNGTLTLTVSAFVQQNTSSSSSTVVGDGFSSLVTTGNLGTVTSTPLVAGVTGGTTPTVTPTQQAIPYEYNNSVTVPNGVSAGNTYTLFYRSDLKYTETSAGAGVNGNHYSFLIDPPQNASYQAQVQASPVNPAATPEPCSLVLAGMGGLGLAGAAWRRRRMGTL